MAPLRDAHCYTGTMHGASAGRALLYMLPSLRLCVDNAANLRACAFPYRLPPLRLCVNNATILGAHASPHRRPPWLRYERSQSIVR
jgi:hypothetical protein